MPQTPDPRTLVKAALDADPDGFMAVVRELTGGDPDRWLTSQECADRLRMSDGNLRTLRHQGKGPRWARREGTILYRETEVIAYERDIEARGEAEREDAQSYQRPQRDRRRGLRGAA